MSEPTAADLACPKGHTTELEFSIQERTYFEIWGQNGSVVGVGGQHDAYEDEGTEMLWCSQCAVLYPWPDGFTWEWQ